MLTNNERDVSQSDFKGRIMPWTTLRAASPRDMVGYFAFEVSGGASVHVDLMKKQINPFDKLSLVRKAMPNTLIQAGVRSHNLFGYRPYGENVIRKVISQIAKYVDVFRVYDFFKSHTKYEDNRRGSDKSWKGLHAFPLFWYWCRAHK